MSARGRPGRSRLLAALLGAALFAGCEALLTDPRPATAEVEVAFQLAALPPGGTATAFARVRIVHLRFVRLDDTFRDTVVAALPVDGTIRAAVSVPVGERAETLGVQAILGAPGVPLFEGNAVVRIEPGVPASALVPILPLPATVVADRPTLSLTLGGTAQLQAAVFFASGDTITGAQGAWISGNPTLVAVSPLGAVLALGLGSTFLEVRFAQLADTVLVQVF